MQVFSKFIAFRKIFSRSLGNLGEFWGTTRNIWESDGSGIQIGLGGRGLNPSRNVNFNTRQNGYDISADALGYPESYYTPPSEAVEEIQMIRGAASLQFGPQFGGLINYKLKKGIKDKKAEVIARHTVGSFGLNNSFLSNRVLLLWWISLDFNPSRSTTSHYKFDYLRQFSMLPKKEIDGM